MRAGGVAAERNDIVAEPGKFPGLRREAGNLPVAAGGVVLHVHRDDGPSSEQVAESDGGDFAAPHHLNCKIQRQLRSCIDHGASQGEGCGASNPGRVT